MSKWTDEYLQSIVSDATYCDDDHRDMARELLELRYLNKGLLAGNEAAVELAATLQRELSERLRECKHFHNAYHHTLEHLAAAEAVIETSRTMYWAEVGKGAGLAKELYKAALDAYDKPFKEGEG